MEYSLVLLTFMLILKMSAGIKCYKCVAEVSYEGYHMCEHFDSSGKYVMDCEHSTMCHKRETTLDIQNGGHVSVYRGCAAQTIPGDQEKINGKWQLVDTIYEPYAEDCQEDHNDPDRPTRTLNCYCRGDLCNSSNTHAVHSTLITLLLLCLVS